MLEFPHKNQQYQQVEHYIYQNQLLSQRNKLLAQQNQRLLEELANCQTKLKQQSMISAQNIINQYQRSKETIARQLSIRQKQLGKQGKKIFGSIVDNLKIQESSSLSLQTFIKEMLKITKILTQKYTELKNQKTKSILSDKQQRLTARRMARDKTQTVLHVIKEPNEFLNWNPKQISQELSHQRTYFEKMIRKVRRQQISMRSIENIYNKLDDCNRLRWSLKNHQSQLTLLERQFQLGSIQTSALEYTIDKISKQSQELNLIRQDIDKAINDL